MLISNEGMATPLSSPAGTFAARYSLAFHNGEGARGYSLVGSYFYDGGATWGGGLELRFEPLL